MTTKRSRSFSIRIRSVSIASRPKSWLLVASSEYASSMKRTPPMRTVDHGVRLDRRLADVPTDEVLTRRLHETAVIEEAECSEDLADQPGDGRLAGSGRAVEDEVMVQVGGPQTVCLPLSLHAEEGDQRPHPLLDGGETDKRIQLGENVLQPLRLSRAGVSAVAASDVDASAGRSSTRSGRRGGSSGVSSSPARSPPLSAQPKRAARGVPCRSIDEVGEDPVEPIPGLIGLADSSPPVPEEEDVLAVLASRLNEAVADIRQLIPLGIELECLHLPRRRGVSRGRPPRRS